MFNLDYHSYDKNALFKEFSTSDKGLTSTQVNQRLASFGRNELQETRKIKPIEIFINQFKSFMILILFLVMVISAVLHELPQAIAVFAILILNAVFGFLQEYKAEKAIEALKKMSSPRAKVIRDGEEISVDSKDVVPGDIILLEEGDKVPADSRLIEIMCLESQEASLTGESLPVQKELGVLPEKTAVANRKNMVYAGTIITKGHGKAVVVATGMKTEFGKIATMIQQSPEEPTHLQVKLKELGHALGFLTMGICLLVLIIGVAVGNDFFEMLFIAIALAVAAIPEGLPAVVTISLALGVQRMIKRNALMRKLPSVETLGSTTVICTDKTGTLTHNEMTVKKLFVNNKVIDVSGSGYSAEGGFSSDPKEFEMLLKIGILNNNAKIHDGNVIGDPTEGCLIVSARKAGMTELADHPRVDEIPFDSQRKLMTTIHTTPSGRISMTKGAPDIIVGLCDSILINGKVERLTKQQKGAIIKQEDLFAEDALRVLGFAYKELGKESKETAEHNMIFVGLQAMIDPPRKEAKEAIAKCKEAGIKVVMVTGDYQITAKAIAKELGIEGIAVTGSELDEMKDFESRVEDIGIFARVNPEHKMMIVEALRNKGHVVAMTGDGVNDAPALKRADIGIAMGITGTDVAKEASDMVLTDDNFTSIVNAIEEGRGVYDNIRKFVKYLLSCNIGEVFTIFLAVLLSLPTPLLPLQILLMNLVTDGLPALALGVEPIEKDVMQQQPHNPKDRIFSKTTLINMVAVGFIMCVGTLGIFGYYMGGDTQKAQTVAFTTLVFFQMFNVINCRSERRSIFRVGFFKNTYLILAVLSSLLLHIFVVYGPVGTYFDTVPLNVMDWVRILMVSCSVFVLVELWKWKNGRA
ncbi:MAG: calcium-translocating P-type ATPase, SERCA-type [Candidatus Woesearchaeota archaeon]